MRSNSSRIMGLRPQALFVLLVLLLGVLWLGGGSARADVAGQALARLASWGVLIVSALAARQMHFRDCSPVFWLFIGFLAVPLIQLIPLPMSIWAAVPGRELFAESFALSSANQSWRPLSVSPGATWNAASSLVVPFSVLFLLANIKKVERSWLVSILLLMVIASALVGILQFAGSDFKNPLINHVPGGVSGTFANRNHFALLLALACVIAPVWAFMRRDQLSWRIPLATAVVLLALLTILASGSRAGMVVGAIAILLGPLVVREDIGRLFRNTPRWTMPAAIAITVAIVALLVFISIMSGRATSIDRLATVDVGGDMRGRGLPTVLAITSANFPFGVGMGGFDAAFRTLEPNAILQLFYFNHAHNDWLELVMEAGAFSVVLLVVTVLWWLKASLTVWRRKKSAPHEQIIGRLGAAMILLVMLASAVDYPLRTPLMMAVVAIAACWLAWGERAAREAASLPEDRRTL